MNSGDHAHGLLEKLRHVSARDLKVLTHVLERKQISRDPGQPTAGAATIGERLADRVASFGGSWTFILCFLMAMAIWMAFNTSSSRRFDPFPYILLNLVLSCLAALQAPIIMMSQNRQAAKDRMDAQQDYEVNLKAELDILSLHTKLDEMRERQIALLERIEAALQPPPTK